MSGGAVNAVVVGLVDVDFRANSLTSNPIRINDARVNLQGQNVSKTGWGSMVSNADTTHSVANVGTMNYSYMPLTGITQLDDLTVVGTVNITQASGDSLKLRRTDFAQVQVGEDDNNTWIVQDNADTLLFQDRRSSVTTSRVQFDSPVTATQTSLLLYDVDNNTLERVTVGIADSGGTGFKVLRILN